jgi:hypothetical protein
MQSDTQKPVEAGQGVAIPLGSPAPNPSQPSQKLPETPDDFEKAKAVEESVYATALDNLLGSSANHPDPATPGITSTPEAKPSGDAGGSGNGSSTGMSAEQVQLLSRSHMTPDMMSSWSQEQRTTFLGNLAKREADQTRSYKELKDQLDEATKRPDTQSGTPTQESGKQPATQSTKQIEETVANLVGIFGDEIKPVGDMMLSMAKQIAAQQAEKDQSIQTVNMLRQITLETAIDSGVSALAANYPSLYKPDVRQKVIDQFHADWKTSPHRNGQATVATKLRSAIGDAVKKVLGDVPETQTQAAVQKIQQNLAAQPSLGHSKGQSRPVTLDDRYDTAVDALMKL